MGQLPHRRHRERNQQQVEGGLAEGVEYEAYRIDAEVEARNARIARQGSDAAEAASEGNQTGEKDQRFVEIAITLIDGAALQ